MVNQWNFIGRLGKDPDSRFTDSGKAIANFSMACTEKWGGEEHTEWVRVVAFGKLAEIIGEYLKKGGLIFLSGKMQTRKWTDKEGQDKWTTVIVARDMKMLGGKAERNDEYAPPKGDDDDIPF